MPELTKLTKAQLIDLIQQSEEHKFDDFKEELGLPYNDADEWIDYIKKLQQLNAERCNDVSQLSDELRAYVTNLEIGLKRFGTRPPN